MLRSLLLLLLALLPSSIKIPLYRLLLGWKIGRNVRIGLSYIDACHATIGNDVRIGRFNRIQRLPRLELCDKAIIGNRNVFMTGPADALARCLNVDPALYVGVDSHIIGPHFFDIHAPIRLERSVNLAGAGSNFYTHGRDYRIDRTKAEGITIGENTWVGAHCLFAPGASIASNTIIGMGAVVTKAFDQEYVLLGGSPARVVKELDRTARFFTRPRPGYPNGRTPEPPKGEGT